MEIHPVNGARQRIGRQEKNKTAWNNNKSTQIRANKRLQKKSSPQLALMNWLQSRQQLMVLLARFSGATHSEKEAILPEALSRFTVCLIDYVSQGHFEIYETLCKRSGRARARFPAVSPQLLQTTEIALVFNEKYTNLSSLDAVTVRDDLSILAEALAIRFELEDMLLS
jgi:regulator of sigma D